MLAAMATQMIEDWSPDRLLTQQEVLDYAQWLGIDAAKDSDLLWIAEAGLKAPLRHPWKPCQDAGPDGDIFYFNFETGESVWDHPADEHYRRLFQIEHKKKNGDDLTEEEQGFLLAAHRPLAPRPCKVGTLMASVSESGVVEVSAISMGGNVLAVSKLKSPSDSFKAVHRRLNKHAGEDLKLVLPDGRLLERSDRKKQMRIIMELPLHEAARQEQLSTDASQDVSKHTLGTNTSSKQRELAPLKIFKRDPALVSQARVLTEEKLGMDNLSKGAGKMLAHLTCATKKGDGNVSVNTFAGWKLPPAF